MENNQRKCPQCQQILTYSHKYKRNEAEKKGVLCGSCASKKRKGTLFENEEAAKSRRCPICQQKITHTQRGNAMEAKKKNTPCRSCSIKKIMSDPKEIYKRKESRIKNGTYFNCWSEQSNEKKRKKMLGSNNPMFQKSVQDVWIEKYGQAEADEREKKWKEKLSIEFSGNKNPMYGKPSPQGSGNGWSGHYKGLYFRSLKELSFIINYLKRFKMQFESLENGKYKIKYQDREGKQRNYYGDFLVNGKYFVEIKPIKLQKSPSNKLKFNAARLFCKQNDLIFKLIDPKINFEQIKRLYEAGEIKFLPKYEEKMKNRIANLGCVD